MNENEPSSFQDFPNLLNTKYREIFFSVMTFSRMLALVLFVALPFLGFWVGLQYGEINTNELVVENKAVSVAEDAKTAPTKPSYFFQIDQDKALMIGGGLYTHANSKWQWNDDSYAKISCLKNDNTCIFSHLGDGFDVNATVFTIEEWSENYLVASGRAGYCWPGQEKDCEVNDYILVVDLHAGDVYLTQSNIAWEETFLVTDDSKVRNIPFEIKSEVLSRLFPACVDADKMKLSINESSPEYACPFEAQLTWQEISAILSSADICHPREGFEVRWLKTDVLNPAGPFTTECTWLATGRVGTYDEKTKNIGTQIIYIDDTTGEIHNTGIVEPSTLTNY